MLSVKVRKEILYNQLNNSLKPEGFKLLNTGEDPCYLKKSEINVQWLGMHFLRAGSITVGLYLSINEIEDLMIEIGKPSRKNMEMYLEKKKYFLSTIRDTHLENVMKEKYHLYAFKTEQEFIQFSKWLSIYIDKKGLSYLEHYSYLPNILAKIEELEVKGKYANEFLSGGPEWFFRYLMISKICNDPKYEKKEVWVNTIFEDEQYSLQEWLPYYKKFKEKLETIEPKYDASLGKVFQTEHII